MQELFFSHAREIGRSVGDKCIGFSQGNERCFSRTTKIDNQRECAKYVHIEKKKNWAIKSFNTSLIGFIVRTYTRSMEAANLKTIPSKH